MLRCILSAVALLSASTLAEIMPFNVMLRADESTIHYYDGYIRSPGSIDLTDLVFVADSNNFVPTGEFSDDGFGDEGDDQFMDRRRLDGGIDTEGTAIDILVFRLPEKCSNSRKGCDYTDLGVGKRADDGTLRWCCSLDAIDKGLCDDESEPSQFGRIIVDEKKFSGDSRFVNIPPTSDVSKRIRQGKLEQMESGHYVVVMANCDSAGRPVAVDGDMIWKSTHGYLPGELYGIMWFYIYLTVVFLGMIIWYGSCMVINEESRIPIEKWILVTIFLGLLQAFYQTSDFYLWNEQGYQRHSLAYMAIITGSLKQGVSRCIAVMVGLGWGVVRDTLGSTMRTIVILATAYTAVSVLGDLLVVFAIEDIQTLSDSEEKDIVQVATLLQFVLAVLDVIFFLWMLDALNNTMEYLENMNQSRKLARYLRLRTILLSTILAAVIWAIFSVVDTFGESGILLEENAWITEALQEIIYTGALLGVAILWRPHPNAKEYAYVMELGGEVDDDLELSGVVPSALDNDDEFDLPSTKSQNGSNDDRIDVHATELS